MEMDVDRGPAVPIDLGATPIQRENQSIDRWSEFLSKCISSRLDPTTFESYVPLVYAKNPLPPVAIADVCLRPLPTNHESLDPRVPRYIQVLAQKKLIDTQSILKALYKYSTSHVQAQKNGDASLQTAPDNDIMRWANSYGAEEVIFYRLTKAVGMGTAIKNQGDAVAVCKVIAQWMSLFTSASAGFAQDVMGQFQSPHSRDEMEASRAAFVMLLLGICENQTVLGALSRPSAKGARKALSESLASFVPSILQSASQIAGRLELFRTETLASFESVTDKKKDDTQHPDIEQLMSQMGLDNIVIPELPITNSRAGLYIYLNAALVGRPLIDDNALFNYLSNRYQGDIQSTTIDLILASFDVVANAVFRNEGQKAGHLLRSYLINKLPLLVATLATSMYPPLTAQFCITEALNQVDTNAFPTLSAMFDETSNNNTFTDGVRQDFCFACCLHGLIPESSIESLIGDITYQTLPAGGRFVKEQLVNECIADPERIQTLTSELENMDGNVGAVSQAITEVIGRLCNNKETMTLKLLCSQLAKKPLSLDVMLLFDKPANILHPLCDLLDNWRYDEDQGEYQPVYEEFGAILLLTMDEMTDQEKTHLDGWIRGLFDTEAGGLGDELMSSCPPQDFYLLVPTLFQNIVVAFSMNYLDEEILKTGIEYLVDTFLLPSLVNAITYMSNQLWVDRQQDQKSIIRILQLILLTKQGSNEAQTMLSAVVNVVAKPLEYSLRSHQRQDPKSQEIEPLLHAIKDGVRLSRRTAGAGHNELESWAGTPNGGLAASIRQLIGGFVQWSHHPGINVIPTSYTHRQILAALRIMGAKRVLQVILEEVKHHTEAGSGSIVHDVATALICAPDVTNVPPPADMTLSGDPTHPPPSTDPAMADNIIRLYRRVETQLHIPQPAETMLPGNLQLGLGGNAATIGDALAAAAQGDGSLVAGEAANMNLGLGAAGNDMGLSGSAGVDATEGLGFGDDDIFGGLGAGNNADLLEGWDGMDLT
ncbi:mediator complex subunit Med5 [Xylariomycetidae sp. FL2044]|nr:mediator complex subunit Med5 [Xylariomycetidae sp. FL2044]